LCAVAAATVSYILAKDHDMAQPPILYQAIFEPEATGPKSRFLD